MTATIMTEKKSVEDLVRRKNGEGSVFQRASDGYWVAQVTTRNTKGPKYRVKYATTEERAWEKLELLLEEEGWLDE